MTDASARNLGGLIDACDRALARLRDPTLPHRVSPRLVADIEAVRADAQRQVNLDGLAPRVLLAEDDPAIRVVCRINLELAGFDVSEAADGDAALLAGRTDPHHVILLDGSLAGLDGWALTAALQADEHTRPIVIVFVSGQTDHGRQADALSLGATAYVAKPFDPTELSDLALRLLAPDGPAAVREAELRRVAAPA